MKTRPDDLFESIVITNILLIFLSEIKKRFNLNHDETLSLYASNYEVLNNFNSEELIYMFENGL